MQSVKTFKDIQVYYSGLEPFYNDVTLDRQCEVGYRVTGLMQ